MMLLISHTQTLSLKTGGYLIVGTYPQLVYTYIGQPLVRPPAATQITALVCTVW